MFPISCHFLPGGSERGLLVAPVGPHPCPASLILIDCLTLAKPPMGSKKRRHKQHPVGFRRLCSCFCQTQSHNPLPQKNEEEEEEEDLLECVLPCATCTRVTSGYCSSTFPLLLLNIRGLARCGSHVEKVPFVTGFSSAPETGCGLCRV